jgi:UPF0042 nucleotide-binding protein
MKTLRVVIITGMSGSGKSTALRALEDIGFFCVDNLPVVLLPKFLEIQSEPAKGITQVAMVMDLREQGLLEKYPRIFSRLREKGYRIEILFLDASDEAILHRFSETRRSHPLAPRGLLMEGIRLEREKLAPLKQMADRVIDSNSCNVHQLKDIVQRHFLDADSCRRLVIHVTSFGYRYGVPVDADMVLDVRFLPNPYFVDELRGFDGHDERVGIGGWPNLRGKIVRSDGVSDSTARKRGEIAFQHRPRLHGGPPPFRGYGQPAGRLFPREGLFCKYRPPRYRKIIGHDDDRGSQRRS